jgi:hypothetical protein
MDKNKDILKDFFKEKLKDYESPVKRDLWSSLESHMSVEKALWRRIYPVVASIAAIVVAVGLLYPYLFKETPDTEDPVTFATAETTQNTSIESGKEKDDEKEMSEHTTPETNTKVFAGISSGTLIKKPVDVSANASVGAKPEKEQIKSGEPYPEIRPVVAEVHSEEDHQIVAETEATAEEEPSVEGAPKNVQKFPESLFPENDSRSIRNHYAVTKLKNKPSSRLRISLSGEGFVAMNNELDHLRIYNSDYLNAYKNQFEMNNLFPDDGQSTGHEEAPHPGLPPDYTLVNIKYDTPVSFGLLFSKNISSRWAMETGVNFSYLSSEEVWEGEKAYYKDFLTSDIKLYYLGIPLRASYSFIQKKRLSVYATGGGMIEKCISGKAITVSKNEGEEKKTNLEVPELQFSVAGNVGIGYRLFKPVSLFVEPGVVYYFDDGSNIMTIRKDKPFNFNIQGGLRFSF